MAKQTTRSGLAEKFNRRKSEKVQIDFSGGGGGWPAGIEGGVAEVVKIGFGTVGEGKNNAGETYFMLRGVCVKPTEHDGIPTAGLQDGILEPMWDTPTRSRKTVDDHVEWVIGVLQDFGIDTKSIDFEHDLDLENGPLSAALAQQRLTFRFRTWKGDKQELVHKGGRVFVGNNSYANEAAARAANPYLDKEPMTQVQYGGACKFDSQLSDDGVVDNTPEADPQPSVPDNGIDEGQEHYPPSDYKSLGEAADSGDVEAQKKLDAAARAQDINPDEIASWAEVAEMLSTPEGAATAEEGDPDLKPAKEEVYFVKNGDKYVEVEVTAVFDAKHTVNVKDLATGRVEPWGRGVAWVNLKNDAKGETTSYLPF